VSQQAEYGNPSYAITRRLTGVSFDDAVARARKALADQGFGVLTEIDVRATLDAKLGVEWPSYLILGACNPPLAHRALSAEAGIGVLLPCNVVVAADGDAVVVSAIDPKAMFSVIDRTDVAPIADEVRTKLVAAIEAV